MLKIELNICPIYSQYVNIYGIKSNFPLQCLIKIRNFLIASFSITQRLEGINYLLLTAKVSSSTNYQINLFACLLVSTFEILLLKGSPANQSEHRLGLTNQSEDSILSTVSADISCSIKTQ